MYLLVQYFPDSELSSNIIQQTPPPRNQNDPLIARGLETEQYIGVIGLAIALIAAVGVLSRRIEYAIVFAFILSVILTFLLLLM